MTQDDIHVAGNAEVENESSVKTVLGSFLSRNKMLLLAIYLVAMVVAATLLILINNPNLMAGTEGGEYLDPPTIINAVLWSFIAVATFLFALAVLYMMGRRRSKR